MRINFAGELLHFSNPHNTGSGPIGFGIQMPIPVHFPLVVQEEVDLLGDTPGETYLRVGQAMAQVRQAGQQRGFSNLGQGTYRSGCFPGLCLCGLHVHGFSSQIIR